MSNDAKTPPYQDEPTQLAQMQFALNAAGVGTWDLDIINQRVWWDDRCKQLYGFKQDDIVPYEQVLSYMHEDDRERVNQAVLWALDPQSGGQYDIQFRTVGASDGQLRWLHCRGQAFFDDQQVAYRFSGIAQDVTELASVRQRLEMSEARFRSLVREAPVAMLVYEGADMVMVEANQQMLDIFGRGDTILDKPLLEAVPELVGTDLPDQYRRVMATGQTHYEYGAHILLIKDNAPYWGYYDYTYKALYDDSGTAYGIICTAIDVTEKVLTHQALQTSEAVLSNAIELAELGTWRMNSKTGDTILSRRHAEMFGLADTFMPYQQALALVHPDDHKRVEEAFLAAQQPGSTGRYQAEYRIRNARTGQQQIIRAVGATTFTKQGEALHIEGTTQDITLERETQRILEEQVQQRTKELQLANEDLQRSNDNLQQFAYVASHDLQEPLRKIQQFGNLLQMRFAGSIDEEGIGYLNRMQQAAERMSTLIRDLLTYSRIATRQQVFGPVSLDAVLADVLATLDWDIRQSRAQIHIDELPVVRGDGSQLAQLLQNLLTNGFKFVKPGQHPQIDIQYFHRSVDELPVDVRPSQQTPFYHQISVRNQGIGFDEKYLDRIFQVFQRLHGKNQYPGTGVGLAICQRVVENHGGAITAASKLGEEATFCIFLPV